MKKVTMYEAFDGKTFATEEACKQYEMVNKREQPFRVQIEFNGFIEVDVMATDRNDAIKKAKTENWHVEDIDWDYSEFYVDRIEEF